MSTTYVPASIASQVSYTHNREVTAAFEYGVRIPATNDLDAVISHYLQFFTAAPSGLHRYALKAAIKRGYNMRNGK